MQDTFGLGAELSENKSLGIIKFIPTKKLLYIMAEKNSVCETRNNGGVIRALTFHKHLLKMFEENRC